MKPPMKPCSCQSPKEMVKTAVKKGLAGKKKPKSY
jgi:hypothetical protein